MTAATKTTAQVFEDVKTRIDALAKRKLQADSIVLSEQAQLERARAEALELLKTADADELRKMFAEVTAENQRVLAESVAEVERAEQAFAKFDQLNAAAQPSA
ncbi:hypothetical protein [Burkholderia cenocepacia]|uniref:hypothetical protein n=1 Tax=Burkholderia cenocepacia TaxID=95486 RepID=UPI000760C607|nr:hypothetical protein [Burkholderia cenocepacia]KWU17799.1 hypothetical protein AS149_13850 [Burkholderia cenocepacia]